MNGRARCTPAVEMRGRHDRLTHRCLGGWSYALLFIEPESYLLAAAFQHKACYLISFTQTQPKSVAELLLHPYENTRANSTSVIGRLTVMRSDTAPPRWNGTAHGQLGEVTQCHRVLCMCTTTRFDCCPESHSPFCLGLWIRLPHAHAMK